MAPEVIQGRYNEKCDIWSCGIIMYILLTGSPPFTGTSKENIMRKIETGVISYTGSKWMNISNEAISLLKRMLSYNYKSRISAKAALNHPWFKCFTKNDTKNNVAMIECISTLKKFQVDSTMKKAVLSFMASHITKKSEERKLKEIFKALDKNNNGTLSLDEMTEGYKLIFNGDEAMAKAEAQRTMDAIDDNKSGEIDYNGKT